MTREDFKHRFPKLASEGENPHRFRKGRVSTSCLQEIFGEPYGEGGRQGYGWINCNHPEVVRRVQYLHPIVYQHTVAEILPHLKIHFAEGIAVEFNEGKGKVDWCAFGAETNKRQVNRYDQAVQKLLALRKTLEGDKPIQVRGRDWLKIKVEPGEARVNPASSSLVKTVVHGDTMKALGKTKSSLGETGDCGGAFQFGLGSGVSAEGFPEISPRGAPWTERTSHPSSCARLLQFLLQPLFVCTKGIFWCLLIRLTTDNRPYSTNVVHTDCLFRCFT